MCRRADLVPAYSVPLPNRVTVHLLGFPEEDADQIASWAGELMVSEFPLTNRTERGEGFAGAFPEFAGYIDHKVDHRIHQVARGKDVPDDVLTRLVQLEVDGERLSPRQLRALTRNLITGGLTTASQLLGNLLFQLLTVPGLEPVVRADEGRFAERGRGEPSYRRRCSSSRAVVCVRRRSASSRSRRASG